MSDSPSWPVQWIVTSPLYQPNSFGFAVAAPVRAGLVLSILSGPKSVLLWLLATSMASPCTVCPAPSLVTVVSPTQPATPLTPESTSVQVNFTSTLVLFQPNPFGPGTAEPVIVGGIVSTFTAMVLVVPCASTLPARSTL